MARNLFGGSAADVAEDIDGARVAGAEGTVWDGPSSGAAQITDLLDENSQPTQNLTADSQGMVHHFYGPDNVTLLYVDFGAGRVAMVPVNTSTDLANHLNATDPHGTKAGALAEINAQRGVAGGFSTLGPDGKVLPAQLPSSLGEDGEGSVDWLSVKSASYGAIGDGVQDDTAAIQNAIDAAGYGGVVYFPKGVYKVSQPLDLPRGVTLLGSHSNLMVGPGMVGDEWPCYLQAAPTFTTGAMINIIGEDDGDHPALNGEQRIFNLMLDGSKVSGWGLDGIYSRGNVQNVVLRDVCIRQMPNNGIVTASVGTTWPYSWRLHSVMVDNCHVNGMVFEGNTDLTLEDCQVIGSWSSGFKLINCANTLVTHSRAEWCGNYGFHITGGWGNWPGSGSMTLTGCSTDRNGWDGVRVDASGNGAFLIQGLMTRRDGRNGGAGGGGYAGLRLSNQAPVVVTGHQNYVGSDDGGTANTSPDYGVSISGARDVQYTGGYLHGLLGTINDDGTNTRVIIGPNTSGVVGNNYAEDRKPITAQVGPVQLTDLAAVGRALGLAHPGDHGLKAWAYDPVMATGTLGVTGGVVYLSAMYIPVKTSVSKILWHCSSAASGVTAGSNFVGLYTSAGVRLASVGIDGDVTSTGAKQTTIPATALEPGMYWVGFVFNATTPPAMARTTGIASFTALVNANLSGASLRFASQLTGQTTLPANLTPGNNNPAASYWAAVS
ncbi:minor tail protein [Streptomyces phage Ibantik]|uniref:Minor tail protein n=1 Tax=Streptomyces phage Ibantik TaxID=2182397 RepID=A0A2U8UNP9_9CAUD|nr:minor tail protein [Streptomyces phage Ibantik]AWN05305.1 minor tail protein [Streptomyces phage Ibantik]